MECFNCASKEKVELLFEYPICEACKSKIAWYKKETVKKYVEEYQSSPYTNSYLEEVEQRLLEMEKDYIKKRMKLLDIKQKIEVLSE